jgi:hypothetical protein
VDYDEAEGLESDDDISDDEEYNGDHGDERDVGIPTLGILETIARAMEMFSNQMAASERESGSVKRDGGGERMVQATNKTFNFWRDFRFAVVYSVTSNSNL